MSELALHGSIARRLLRPVLLYGAFAAVLVIGERRVQILLEVSLPSLLFVMSVLDKVRGNAPTQYSSLSRNFCRWEGLIL